MLNTASFSSKRDIIMKKLLFLVLTLTITAESIQALQGVRSKLPSISQAATRAVSTKPTLTPSRFMSSGSQMTVKQAEEILGVSKGSPEIEINNAYRRLAKSAHPDVAKNLTAEQATAKMQAINSARAKLLEKQSAGFGYNYGNTQQVNWKDWAKLAFAGSFLGLSVGSALDKTDYIKQLKMYPGQFKKGVELQVKLETELKSPQEGVSEKSWFEWLGLSNKEKVLSYNARITKKIELAESYLTGKIKDSAGDILPCSINLERAQEMITQLNQEKLSTKNIMSKNIETRLLSLSKELTAMKKSQAEMNKIETELAHTV